MSGLVLIKGCLLSWTNNRANQSFVGWTNDHVPAQEPENWQKLKSDELGWDRHSCTGWWRSTYREVNLSNCRISSINMTNVQLTAPGNRLREQNLCWLKMALTRRTRDRYSTLSGCYKNKQKENCPHTCDSKSVWWSSSNTDNDLPGIH